MQKMKFMCFEFLKLAKMKFMSYEVFKLAKNEIHVFLKFAKKCNSCLLRFLKLVIKKK